MERRFSNFVYVEVVFYEHLILSFGSYRGNTLLLGLMSYVRPSVRPSVQNASQRNPSLTDEPIMRTF